MVGFICESDGTYNGHMHHRIRMWSITAVCMTRTTSPWRIEYNLCAWPLIARAFCLALLH